MRKLILGALLHDIGKIVYRQGADRRKHSLSGYEFLKHEIGLTETGHREILEAVRYHHWDMLKDAEIAPDSCAYIVYAADNIASAADRRKNDSGDAGFEVHVPLESVFNILNGNCQKQYYEPGMLDKGKGIPYPSDEKKLADKAFYTKLLDALREGFRGMEWTDEYMNSLMSVLEAQLSYVPASTARDEKADISLYDHLKLTAAAASCIYEYLLEQGVSDFRDRLFTHAKKFYQEEAFLLYSMDVSGIQDFIYTTAGRHALKTLRARSFYLEIMMEHIIDSLLEQLHLSRASLIYSGGGHCYLLLPNTARVRHVAEQYLDGLNRWLMDTFQISLYVASGYAPCSAAALRNEPEGSYKKLFHQAALGISRCKGSRYSPADIRRLNGKEHADYTRECMVCRRIGKTDEEGVCPVCRAIEKFSANILYDDFFTVMRSRQPGMLPLPGGYWLAADSRETLTAKMQEGSQFVRAYSKNRMFTGKHAAAKLWCGDYTTGKTFEEYAREAEGIERIGILRADVDNLGQAFVAGFENAENQDRYVTLSRTASLSRQLSLFFKLHISQILERSSYGINGKPAGPRNATICYSGGDDLFIAGSWNDIIELAVDIRRAFARYTQGTLTLSAGIGIYAPGYPIRAAASETGVLEDCSKSLPGKNAVTLLREVQADIPGTEAFGADGTYCWQELEQEVIGEKYQVIRRFFDFSDERGKSFLYRLLELIRSRGEKIQFARYVYLLSRMEPEQGAGAEQMEAYREFFRHMYQWIKSEKDCRQLKTAISLYAYMTREKEAAADGSK